MKRYLLWLAISVSFAAIASGVPNPKFPWPDKGGGEVLLAWWSVNDGAVGTLPRCAAYDDTGTSDLSCGVEEQSSLFTRNVTITRVDVVAGAANPPAGADGCGITVLAEVPVGAAAGALSGIAEVNYGAGAVAGTPDVGGTVGGTFSQAGLSVSVAAGTALMVQHTTPTDTTYCDTTPCVCLASNVNYRLEIYGSFN